MKAIDVFRKHKSEIVRLWTDAVFDTYPLETTGFLRTKEDPFGNPVANMDLRQEDLPNVAEDDEALQAQGEGQ